MTMAYLMDWLQLFFRWFHVIAGIAWIGASFYFIWLDNNLREPPQWKKDKGIKGDLWAIHGGGYYEVAKYQLGPEEQPETLHWFKWEAYTTWLTGMVLMVLIYYVGAQAYLVDASKFAFTTPQAVMLSVASLLVGLAIYEALLRSRLRRNGMAFGIVLFLILTFYAWLMTSVFSGRGAYIQVGALIGTIMAGNVFLGIMPAQRKLVAAVQAGETPDPAPALMAKLRSTHNNYLTLPIIFIMLSNHYPMTYGHELNWLVLAAIGAISAYARHFFNLKHQGKVQPAILVIALVALAGLAFLMAPPSAQTAVSEERSNAMANVSTAQIDDILQARCATCHATNPSSTMFSAAPAGLNFEHSDQLLVAADRAVTSMRSGYMPLGNMTGMTDEERALLIDWVAAQR
ncbi:urate hydroxylase PuuD [Salinispirillum marinum]|uniref:Urate hydroxylase PuuD n=2 Tax=Saccharospirillaceae TaxID=255527 RepID=A0ABV8BDU6_9GAMM